MLDCNPVTTLADPHIQQEKNTSDIELSVDEKHKYQSAVSSLMYAMLSNSPDLVYAVSKVSQFSLNPSPTYFTVVKRLFRYLAGTFTQRVYYGRHRWDATCTELTDMN